MIVEWPIKVATSDHMIAEWPIKVAICDHMIRNRLIYTESENVYSIKAFILKSLTPVTCSASPSVGRIGVGCVGESDMAWTQPEDCFLLGRLETGRKLRNETMDRSGTSVY